jgi:hypothetical protein
LVSITTPSSSFRVYSRLTTIEFPIFILAPLRFK